MDKGTDEPRAAEAVKAIKDRPDQGKDWNEGVAKGLLTKEQIESAKRSNQPQGYTLGPGQTRYAPGGGVEASIPAAEEEVSMVVKLVLIYF